MKKLLLTLIVVLLSGTVYAQKQYDIKEAQEIAKLNKAPGLTTTYKGVRVYFDPSDKKYYMEEPFKRKYGNKTVETLDSLYKVELSKNAIVSGSYQHEISSQKQIASADNQTASPFLAKSFGSRHADIYQFDNKGRSFKWKLTPLNTVVGSSMIGASAAAYMLTSSIIDNKMANESDVEKISSLAKTKRTVGFVCAGTSVVGIVVVLTGLHKEYAQGIEIGHNLTVSDYGAGISLTKKF